MPAEVAPPLADGRYHLLAVLGEGGMSTVFHAWDERLKVHRAVKVLTPALAHHENIRKRFQVEATTTARLHHPNIVTVHDVSAEGRRAFMVMELVSGGSLMRRVERSGPLPPRMACDTLIAVLSALQYAHDHGVVHRDVKPHNILLSLDGTPKLTDFGIARVLDNDMNLTRTGAAMGTPAYMSPEQRGNAGHVDARADIFSTGATLYALLTAKEPFDIYAVEHQDRLFSGLPEPLVSVIRTATRYNPEERFASAAAMLAELKEACALLPLDPEDATPLVVGPAGPDNTHNPLSIHTTPPHAFATSIPPDDDGVESDRGSSLDAFPSLPGTTPPPRPPISSASLSFERDLSSEPPPRRATLWNQTLGSGWFWGVMLLTIGSSLAMVTLLIWLFKPKVADVQPGTSEDPTSEVSSTPGGGEAGEEAAPEGSDPSANPTPAGDDTATATPAEGTPTTDSSNSAGSGSTSGAASRPKSTPEPVADPTTTTGTAPRTQTSTTSASRSTIPGYLVISSKPKASVFLGVQHLGRTKVRYEVNPGVHRVVLETDEGDRQEVALRVVSGEETRYCWDFRARVECN